MKEIWKKKILTGSLLVPPIVFLIAVAPPAVLSAMVLLAVFFGLREFYTLSLPMSKGIDRLMGIGLGVILCWVVMLDDPNLFPLFLALLLLIVSVAFLASPQNLTSTIPRMGIQLMGMFYIGFLLSHVSLIRKLPNGEIWVLLLIMTVWAGDIFAFLIGSLFGKHKLYPKISPNKTFEGLGGAIAGSIAVVLIYSVCFIPSMPWTNCVLIGTGIALLGQLGDFTESMLKRGAEVKDSGSLIPGHGGMLDRIDSFLFSAPFLHYFLLYSVKEAR